jgi:hypothetical protein
MPPRDAIRLPKTIEADPRAALLVTVLAEPIQRSWAGGVLNLPEAQPSDGLREALRAAQRAGRVVRSLEKAEALLTAEDRGLRMADRKSGASRRGRISRLLVVSADGSERFYRQVAALLKRNEPRLAAICISVDARELGRMLFGPGASVRLVMIHHKETVAAVLLALAEQWALSKSSNTVASSP